MWLIENSDWINISLRWFHVIAGIAWIGSSFYFIALDLSLKRAPGMPDIVTGEQWSVHGGGFYHIQKYSVAPENMPKKLHWYKYESYFTWISGFSLLVVMYYMNAETFLIDSSVADISKETAIVTSLLFIIGGWLAYDLLCRSPIGKQAIVLGVTLIIFITAASYLAGSIFSGRAALLHVGVITATIMTGNVFFIIIPNQKKVVASLLKREQPEASLGIQAKQRSTHNNYLALPVILTMISNHYPILYAHEYIWVVTPFLFAIGAIIRDFFNTHHKGQSGIHLLWQWPLATILGVFLLAFLYNRPDLVSLNTSQSVSQDEAFNIVQNRCVVCHSKNPAHPLYDLPPLNVRLDKKDYLNKHADSILKQVVLTNAMPPANETNITQEERQMLGIWIKSSQ